MKSTWLVVLGALWVSGGLVSAHHSFAAAYDDHAKPVTLKGQIVQLLFRSPHSFVHVMAPDEHGQMQRWAVEWGGITQLERSGITRETLKPGDDVVITGMPARNTADHRMLVRKIERPADGWKWSGTFE